MLPRPRHQGNNPNQPKSRALLGASPGITPPAPPAPPGPKPRNSSNSADGGKTWTLTTPADWANAAYSWWPNSIDCVSTTTCWLAGQTANSTQNPEVAETSDGGRTWTTFSNLPATPPDTNGDTYALDGISCTSARVCVAVGGVNGGPGPAAVISTTNGGAASA